MSTHSWPPCCSTKELKPALGNAGAMLGSREGIMGTSIGMLTPGMCFGETLREDRKRQYTVVALGSTSGRPTELVRMSIKGESCVLGALSCSHIAHQSSHTPAMCVGCGVVQHTPSAALCGLRTSTMLSTFGRRS